MGKKAEATQAAAAPPASRTQAQTSQRASDIPPPAASRRTQLRLIHKKVKKLEPEAYKALSVMDEKTGQNDDYQQLMKHPEYKCNEACHQQTNSVD